MQRPQFTVPGMSAKTAANVIEVLDQRMVSLIDLTLTLKHVHWNVVGPNFIAVHEMLDEHLEVARTMVDDLAERIATLGGTPVGTAAALVKRRSWNDYPINKATAKEHLAALEVSYTGIIEDHRLAQKKLADTDPMSEDLIIGQARKLEHFQWFIRAQLETNEGRLIVDANSELEAASQVAALRD
jgi:starvation-inducible DNA-binding protein